VIAIVWRRGIVCRRRHSVRGKRRWSEKKLIGEWKKTPRRTRQNSPTMPRPAVCRWDLLGIFCLLPHSTCYNTIHSNHNGIII